MGMILRIASSRIVGQGDIVGRSGYFSLNLSANSVMRGRLDARRTLKSLVADLRSYFPCPYNFKCRFFFFFFLSPGLSGVSSAGEDGAENRPPKSASNGLSILPSVCDSS